MTEEGLGSGVGIRKEENTSPIKRSGSGVRGRELASLSVAEALPLAPRFIRGEGRKICA